MRKNEILAYMVTCFINTKVELIPRCPMMRNMIFEPIGSKFGKYQVLRCLVSQKEILAYMVANLINGKVEIVS